MSFGGAPEPEGRNWRFDADGRFFHQNSVTASGLKHAGYWRIEEGKLEIKPIYMGGPQQVTLQGPDNFQFHWQATLGLERGACP